MAFFHFPRPLEVPERSLSERMMPALADFSERFPQLRTKVLWDSAPNRCTLEADGGYSRNVAIRTLQGRICLRATLRVANQEIVLAGEVVAKGDMSDQAEASVIEELVRLVDRVNRQTRVDERRARP